MKKLLLLCTSLFATMAQAQNFSVGIRSGVDFLKGDIGQISSFVVKRVVWNNGLFARYESKKHIALEAGASTFFFRSPRLLVEDYYTEEKVTDYYKMSRVYAYDFRMQYGFRCGRSRALMNYPGIVISVLQEDMTEYADRQNRTTGEVRTDQQKLVAYNFRGGVEDLVRYSISNHVQVHALLGYWWSTQPDQMQRSVSGQFGAAWKF